ncbi:DUF3817 domain-containing protein [Nesterenkonia alba]|uniref:DUF3817 domain-containing protein n=1 Tax=Nesterenkonia alba TaxID=515814 RepID=UPI0003B33653|nr:DUF3817 domain-containing protein [Nesterenkonia alba]
MTENRTETETAADQGQSAGEQADQTELSREELEAKIPPAPPRPGKNKRRFGGTVAQLNSALNLYRVLAFITGIFLLLLVVKMVADYGFGLELYVGGTLDGEEHSFGVHPQGAVVEGQAVSSLIAIVHGWVYVIYLIVGARLWYMMSWPISRMLLIVAGGLVPFLSFIMERKITREARAEIAAHPDAARRY